MMGLSKNKLRTIGWALILAASLIGFIWVSLKNQSLNRQLQQQEQAFAERTRNFQTQHAASLEQLRLAELNNQLGMLMIMTQEKNFGEARALSTQFFNGLRQFIQDTGDNSLRAKLTAIINRRDEITSDLTTADAGVTDKLRAFYHEMYGLRVEQE